MSGDVTVRDDKFTMPSDNVEIKAIFEEDAPPTPTEYTVTFDGNDGTPSVDSMTTTKQKLTSLPDASRSKHSFNGWYTEKSGGTKITTDTVFSAIPPSTPTGRIPATTIRPSTTTRCALKQAAAVLFPACRKRTIPTLI